MWLFRSPLIITFELDWLLKESSDRRFDWQIRDKVKVHLNKGTLRQRFFLVSSAFGRRIEDPRRTREKTSGTQGRSSGSLTTNGQI